MSFEGYFRSLGSEMDALKDRIRQLIEGAHWQTDGEWKEAIVRHVLRRHLPQSAAVGRGFVVTPNASSRQLDVLIFDTSKPVLFRDGDLIFATPDAVLGVVEVKSSATPSAVAEAAGKLGEDMAVVRKHPNPRAFAAFFAFEENGGDTQAYLQSLAQAAPQWDNRVDFVCVGRDRFLRYWHLSPGDEKSFYERWCSYSLRGAARGYFVRSVVDAVNSASVFNRASGRNNTVWFLPEDYEAFKDGEILASWAEQTPK